MYKVLHHLIKQLLPNTAAHPRSAEYFSILRHLHSTTGSAVFWLFYLVITAAETRKTENRDMQQRDLTATFENMILSAPKYMHTNGLRHLFSKQLTIKNEKTLSLFVQKNAIFKLILVILLGLIKHWQLISYQMIIKKPKHNKAGTGNLGFWFLKFDFQMFGYTWCNRVTKLSIHLHFLVRNISK